MNTVFSTYVESLPKKLMISFSLWEAIKNYIQTGVWLHGPVEMGIKYKQWTVNPDGEIKIKKTFISRTGESVSNRHPTHWSHDPRWKVPPVENFDPPSPVVDLPIPPFAVVDLEGDVNEDGGEIHESFTSSLEFENEVSQTIKGWCETLESVPDRIPWMSHNWASYNSSAGDYGGSYPVKVKTGTTLEEIREWVNNLS